jgi:uncharacterized protein (TIGR02147 family)
MLDVTKYSGFREYLSDILNQRRINNSNYSLRAFARDLGLQSGQLSEVLGGKKGLSLKKALQVAARLGMGAHETTKFVQLIQTEGMAPEQKLALKVQFDKAEPNVIYKDLRADTFKVISDWYHYAILEMSLTDTYDSNPQTIAHRLQLTVSEVKQALERMLKLELLEPTAAGKLMKTQKGVTTTKDFASQAIRNFNRQILKKAYQSLELPLETRDFSTMTMAIDPSKLEEAKALIKNFRRTLCEFLESGSQKKVYCLAVQLFPLEVLTPPEKTK